MKSLPGVLEERVARTRFEMVPKCSHSTHSPKRQKSATSAAAETPAAPADGPAAWVILDFSRRNCQPISFSFRFAADRARKRADAPKPLKRKANRLLLLPRHRHRLRSWKPKPSSLHLVPREFSIRSICVLNFELKRILNSHFFRTPRKGGRQATPKAASPPPASPKPAPARSPSPAKCVFSHLTPSFLRLSEISLSSPASLFRNQTQRPRQIPHPRNPNRRIRSYRRTLCPRSFGWRTSSGNRQAQETKRGVEKGVGRGGQGFAEGFGVGLRFLRKGLEMERPDGGF